MSREGTNLPVSLEAARDYVLWLSSLSIGDRPLVKAIYLSGSRSPMRDKKPRVDSDWDFNVIPAVNKLVIDSPKDTDTLFADVSMVTNVDHLHPKAVMVFPEDVHGIFS